MSMFFCFLETSTQLNDSDICLFLYFNLYRKFLAFSLHLTGCLQDLLVQEELLQVLLDC